MKRRFLSYLISLILIVSSFPVFHVPVYAAFREIDEEVYPAIKQNFTPLDLSKAANMGFADEIAGDGKGGWTDQGSINDLREFTLRGLNQLQYVDFYIIDPDENDGKSCIVLRGQNNEFFPTSAEIPVNAKGAGVYFLHACAWPSDIVGRYRFVYEDGTNEVVLLRRGKDIFNWWGTGFGERCRVAWSGLNGSTSVVSLYIFACENPQPSKKIEKIIAETDGNASFLMVVAATLTDVGPYIVKPKDVGNPDMSHWFPYVQPSSENIKGTALDMSFILDAPAGKHGFVTIQGDKFVFEDGTEARFWGTNLVGVACFPSHERAVQIADRIAQLGFNLVRFHHMDHAVLKDDNIFGTAQNSRKLDDERMDRLCFLMNELKKRGIYFFVDQTVAQNPAEDDNIQDSSSLSRGMKEGAYFDERIIEVQENYTEMLLTYRNPYTGLTLAEDPAMVFVVCLNENSLFRSVKTMKSPYYINKLNKLFCNWLIQKYKTEESLKDAWKAEGFTDIDESESLADGTISAQAAVLYTTYSPRRKEDTLNFIYDVQLNYYYRRKKQFERLGVKCPVSPFTAWGDNAMYLAAAQSDFVDLHNYWSHPNNYYTLEVGAHSTSNKPVTQMASPNMGTVGYIMNRRVFGKPVTMSEWNICELTPTMSEGSTLMAAFARMHNWNPLKFDFLSANRYNSLEAATTLDDTNEIFNFFDIDGHPVRMSALPAASLLFLREDVKEADTGFFHRYSSDAYKYSNSFKIVSEAYLGLIGKTGIAIEDVAYDPEYNNNDILYLAKKAKEEGTPFVSVTGELSTDLKEKIFKLNTERSQAIIGHIKGKSLELDDIVVKIDNEFATINLTSLTDAPIWDSDRLLLTTVGDARNAGQKMSGDGTTIVVKGSAPIMVEPITGEVTIKTKDTIRVFALTSSGQRDHELKVTRDHNGFCKFVMGASDQALHYEIIRVKRFEGPRGPNPKVVLGDNTVEPLYDDLQGYEWAEKQIIRMSLQDFISGTSDKKFNPAGFISKADYVGMIVRGLGFATSFKTNFDDIDKKNPHYTQIGIARELNIVTGDENNMFHPTDKLTREELLIITIRAMEEAGRKQKQKYIQRINNLWKEIIGPSEFVTRAEATYIAYMVIWE